MLICNKLFFSLCLASIGAIGCSSTFIAPAARTSALLSRSKLFVPQLEPLSTPNGGATRLFGRRGGGGDKKEKKPTKSNLPEKICVVCGRPFTWRKKWERSWDEITCCSKICNAKRRSMAKEED